MLKYIKRPNISIKFYFDVRLYQDNLPFLQGFVLCLEWVSGPYGSKLCRVPVAIDVEALIDKIKPSLNFQ